MTTVCPIREEAPTVMRFFLTYAYRHKAPLVRDLRAGKTRCSRIRVFVDRANDCRYIHIQNHVHRCRRPVRSLRTSLYARKCCRIYRMSRNYRHFSRSLSEESRTKQNACLNAGISTVFEILKNSGNRRAIRE